MRVNLPVENENYKATMINGSRYSLGAHRALHGSLQIRAGRFEHLYRGSGTPHAVGRQIDLDGFLVLPGLINAHDHLQYALHPRIGHPPYRNYIEWGDDIHTRCSEMIGQYNSVPRDIRLWWGGIRNVLCGVTTVCHHDPMWSLLQAEDYPVKVLRAYGWAHSVGLDPNIRRAWDATPDKHAFCVHISEGTDELARREIFELDRLGMLNAKTVVVHGLALDNMGIGLLRERQASIIICVSSNQFLYHRTPRPELVRLGNRAALGSDSPLTAAGDLLDEVRFAAERVPIPKHVTYRMITEDAAAILRLCDGEGNIRESGSADLIAVRDNGDTPCERMCTLSWRDIELVMLRGKVQLASEDVLHRFPRAATEGMEPLRVDGYIRWLRAPIRRLVQQAENVLGRGLVRLGERKVQIPRCVTDTSTNTNQPLSQSAERT